MRVFLSYRRSDSSAWAGRLRDALASRLGEENVFQDVAAVRPGQSFTAAIEGALSRSDATLAVIGPQWLTATSADGLRHLTDEHDHVRAELSAALRLGGLIVPVLVGQATMPNPEQLPDDLKPLAVLQAVTLSDETWSRDLEDLLEAIGVESRPARTRRMIIVTGAALAAVAVVALAILVRSDGDDGSSDPPSLKPQCSASAVPDEWDQLTPSDSVEIGSLDGALGRVAVVDAGSLPAESDSAWDVLLRIDYTALTDDFQSQDWRNYRLTAGGSTFDPSCFSLTGGLQYACCGEVTELVVGFAASVDPVDGGALLITIDDAAERIDLTAA